MNDAEKKARITGLIEERRGYMARGLDDRVKAVDAELSKLGEKAAAPAARATKRPAVAKSKAKETR